MIDHIPMPRPAGTRRRYDRAIRTVCQECTMGCGLTAYVHQGRLVDLHGDENHPVNRGRVCAKGLSFIQGLDHPERLRRATYRTGLEEGFNDLKNRDRALSILAGELTRLRDRYGPESLVIGCDPEAGMDFYLGARRFARLYGTPYVHHPLDVPNASLDAGLHVPDRPGYDWVRSGCLFLVEADLASTHPAAFQWVLEARERGARIIAADARFTPTMAKADRSFYIAPASGNYLGLALLKRLMASGRIDADALDGGISEADAFRDSVAQLSDPDLEEATLASGQTIETLTGLLSKLGPVTLITGKRLSFLPNHRVWPVMSLLSGWTTSGGGWHPLESGRPPLNPETGLAPAARAVASGRGNFSYQFARESESKRPDTVKAIISTGNCLEDFMISYQSQSDRVDLAVYFGSFPNPTWERSHLVFPAALWPEKDSLFFTQDRAVCFNRSLADPPPECLSGLDFWAGLAEKMGWAEHFPWAGPDGRADAVAFYQWNFEQSPWLQNGRLDEIEQSGLVSRPVYWPLGEDGQAESSLRPGNGPIDFTPFTPPVGADPGMAAGYPLRFQATRLASRSGEASRWWPWTGDLEDDRAVQIHPDLAAALGLENGDEVVVRGPRYSMDGRVWLNRMTPRWLVWSPRRLGDRRVVLYKKRTDPAAALANLERFLK